MCWVVDPKSQPTIVLTCLLLGMLGGCATTQGVLFPKVEPPRVWPSPPDRPRIKLVGQIVGSGDLKAARNAGEAFRAALRGPRPPINFSAPHGVAISDRGLIAVADSSAGAVHILDLETRTHVLVSGFGQERFGAPVGVAWAVGRLFVTDALRHEVIELDAQGRYRNRFGADQLGRPVGIAYVAQRERLYVVDGKADQLIVFDPAGNVTGTLGRSGVAPGEFNRPTHLSAMGDRLLVADSGNARVQLLDLDGRVITVIGHRGNGAGDFSLPKGVAFDQDHHIYVVDAHFENIQVFDDQGQLLLSWGSEGDELGEFSLPAGLAIDRYNRIWVADSANHRLQVFDYLGASS